MDSLSFEAAFAELETTVQRLEEGNLPLDEAVALYERGVLLARLCGQQLDAAELRVQQLSLEIEEADEKPVFLADDDEEEEPF
jgi:exodeoxyribonuclease VII small subunit